MTADPKPARRHRASREEWNRMREQRLGGRWCAACGRARADELHHVVRKSQSGDDFSVNLLELCRACHALVEARDRAALAQARTVIYQRPGMYGYIVGKKGQGWLDRAYPEMDAA